MQGIISLGMVVAYYQAFQVSLTSLQTVLQGFARLYEDNLFLTYYDEFMTLDSRLPQTERPRPVPRPLEQGIVLKDVGFSYPDTDRTALEDVSLAIRPGEITALVGPNGSGKTTLVKLLCRLYDPAAGSITIDGIDLRDVSLVELRRQMSVIFQDFAQYQLAARENIRLGNVDLAPDDPAVETAARDAGAHETITGLRHGYDTLLGKWFDEGEELSVGEWQEMALARAFVRDAQVLVFDEPTSALDPRAEWEVFQHIRELASSGELGTPRGPGAGTDRGAGPASGRAVVLISHRFSTVRNADRIYIFDGGRVIESGTHDELVAVGGRYAEMYEVQARAYRTGE